MSPPLKRNEQLWKEIEVEMSIKEESKPFNTLVNVIQKRVHKKLGKDQLGYNVE